MKRFWGTLHIDAREDPSLPPVAEGPVTFRFTGTGVVKLELDGECLMMLVTHQADGLYAGQAFLVPGGRLLRLHASREEVVPLLEAYETSKERMLTELDEILASD